MQRHRLLSAVVEVLAEHGLEAARVGRICARAGVSRRTFYDLFEDREACFLAAFDLAIERLGHKVVQAYEREGRWCERIRSALVTLLESLEEEPGLARLCLVETLKGGTAVLERRRSVLDTLIAAIDGGRGETKGAQPPPLTGESTVGGAIAVIHARLVAGLPLATGGPSIGERDARPRAAVPPSTIGSPRMVELLNPLMSMIVLPYLGPAASRRELDRPAPVPIATSNGHAPASDPFKDLPIRITFRTVRVLATIAAQPGASNRGVGEAAGVADQGQMSKLLRRLERSGLIENHGEGQAKGEPNAWQLTPHGHGVLHALDSDNGT
jgi:AcrR family transcriptional regulator